MVIHIIMNIRKEKYTMQKPTKDIENILSARFGKDNLLPLATMDGCFPTVRNVNAYYENGAFYVITHAASDKMKQLSKNAACAVCGEWFSAQGIGVSLGFVGLPENSELFEKLKNVFSEWINNGHINVEDKNCIILKIRLTSCVLFSDNVKYEVDFT